MRDLIQSDYNRLSKYPIFNKIMSHTKEQESVVNTQGKKEAMETALEGAQTMD